MTALMLVWDLHSATVRGLAGDALSTIVSHAARDAEDLVSEVFARLLTDFRSGDWPPTSCETYLREIVLDIAWTWNARAEYLSTVTEAIQVLEHPEDVTLRAFHRKLTVDVFSRLPHRWQTVLWHTEVNDLGPAEVGSLMNLTANSATALAFRARAGLRKAWHGNPSVVLNS